MTVYEEIKAGLLLRNTYDIKFTREFISADFKEKFVQNLTTQNEDWYYRTHDVKYVLNSKGFRAPEFENIDWNNTVVIFGASDAFSIGVDEKDTLSVRLSEITGKSVVSLGVCKASITHTLHNLAIFRKFFPKPAGIIMMWPPKGNVGYYYPDRVQKYSDIEPDINIPLVREWHTSNHHIEAHNLANSYVCEQICKDIPYYATCSLTSTASVMQCEHIDLLCLDKSRDLEHGGIESLKVAAKTLASKLKL